MRPTYYEALLRMYDVPEYLIQELEGYRLNGDWDNLCAFISGEAKWLEYTFPAYYPIIPDEYRYGLLICCHTRRGDGIACIRKEVRQALKYGSPAFPSELDGIETFTVYRAGDEAIDLAPYRLSWTLDRDRAIWFMGYSGYRKHSAMHLYEGTIRRNKVIAYTDERQEKEIIQYRNVRDIKELSLITEEQAKRLYLTEKKDGLLAEYRLVFNDTTFPSTGYGSSLDCGQNGEQPA